MSSISISQSYTCSSSDAKTKLATFTSSLSSKYSWNTTWSSTTSAKFTGTNGSGTITIGTSDIVVTVDLGFLYASLSTKIKTDLTSQLTTLFG